MATYTTYLNLEKPTTSETFNLLKMNQNWDKIDAGVSALNSNLNSSRKSYEPTITGGSGFTVSNVNFTYLKIGKALFIGGRFNVTNVGSEASDSNISFSLPEGLTCYDVVGSSGSVSVNSSTIDTSMLSVRQSNNCFYIQKGAGGMGSIAALGTGYVMINAMIMLA